MLEDYQKILDKFSEDSRLREIPADRSALPRIDMTSNDYMGLGAKWHDFLPSFLERYPEASFSSSASRLLSSRQSCHNSLENLLATYYGKDVLLFNSGYHANVGIVQALNIPGTVFLCDKLIHASMLDGLMLSKAEFQRWRHNDIESLRKLLDKYSNSPLCVVMVESIYSMDGDSAPLQELTELKKEYPGMLLYVDEAHAFGTRGRRGLGLSEEYGLIDSVDILVGTLGKAAASVGAFVATCTMLKNYFVNCSRSFIFSTALPPVNAAWSELMVETLMAMESEREHLMKLSRRFREGIETITGERNESCSHIVPWIIGDAGVALDLAARMSEAGVDVLPIRRPTVPPGGERIRFSLSAAMEERAVDRVLEIINGLNYKRP